MGLTYCTHARVNCSSAFLSVGHEHCGGLYSVKKRKKKYRLWGQDVWAKSWILCICPLWPLQAYSSPVTWTHEKWFTTVSLDFQENFLRVNFGVEIGSAVKIWLESTQKKAWAKPPSLETWGLTELGKWIVHEAWVGSTVRPMLVSSWDSVTPNHPE